MLANSSEVVLRNIDQLSALNGLLLINPPADELMQQLGETVQASTSDFATYQCISTKRSNVHFGVELPRDQQFQGVLLFMPKAKEELRFRLAQACSVVDSNGFIFLLGHKKEGIAGGSTELKKWGRACKVDTARHCQLWQLQPDQKHCSEPFDLDNYWQSYELPEGDKALKVYNLPGVFSMNQLDQGTDFLLKEYPFPLKGHWLDFACGAGVIGAWHQLNNPDLKITGVDTSALALHCARKTFADNGLQGDFYAANGFSAEPGYKRLPLDGIITNPPFHTGVKTDYSVTEQFITESVKNLRRGGRMVMVANSFLNYPALLESVYGNCKTIAKNNKFAIYESVRYE
ncbi:MAG: methyltransferase [Pseudomonadales bacterium]|nr:methyltransferase [Pseudomonadales bacterium]